MAVIEVNNVWKAYCDRKKETATIVLKDLSLTIEENEFVCVIGPSGCGKTTLLNLIAGFEKPQRGEILYRGEKITGPSVNRAVVFQEYSLFPWLRVLKNVEFSLKKYANKKERTAVAKKYLEMVGLSEFMDYRPSDLSGGMKQRVAIARTLAMEPDVLLMDEPFSSLDEQTRSKLDNEILDIWMKNKKTFLYITHHIDEALLLGTRIVMLSTTPGTVAVEWLLPEGKKNLSSEELVAIKNDIMKKLQTCSCTAGVIQICEIYE